MSPPTDYQIRFPLDDGSGNAVGTGPGAVTLTGTGIYTGRAKHGAAGAATTWNGHIFEPASSGFDYGAAFIDLGSGTGGWTIAFWTYEDAAFWAPYDPATDARSPAASSPASGNRVFASAGFGGDIVFYVTGASFSDPTSWVDYFNYAWAYDWSALATGWHHVALVGDFDAGTTALYVDGALVGTIAAVTHGTVRTLLNSQSAGDSSVGDMWGAADEISFWLRPLSSGEIGELYHEFDPVPAGSRTVATGTEFVHLIELDYSGAVIRLCTGAADLNWDSHTWEAVGGNLTFGGVQESSQPRDQGVDFEISGVDQTVLAALLGTQFRGRVVRVWRAWLDPVLGTVVPDPLLLFEGLQTGAYTVDEERSRETGTVRIRMRALGYLGVPRDRGIQTNLASHQHIFPGDTFFQNVAALAHTQIYWAQGLPIPTGQPRKPRRPRDWR